MAATLAEQPTPDPLAPVTALTTRVEVLEALVAAIDDPAEIKALLDALSDTNLLTDAERTAIAAHTTAIAAIPAFPLSVANGGTASATAAAARAALGADDHPLGCYFTFTGAAAAYTTELQVLAFRAPYAMTISSAHLISAKTSTGSTGSIYWESYVRNVTAAVDLCSAKKNTSSNGELTIGVAWDMAVNQNLSIAAGDVIACTVRSLGGPTTMINIPWTWCIVAKRT